MRKIRYTEEPVKIFGVPHFDKTKKLQRLPYEMAKSYEGILQCFPKTGVRCPGARMCFRTNSETFRIGVTFETLSFDLGMSIFACQSAQVLIGERKSARYAGIAFPENYEQKSFTGEFKKSGDTEDITVFLPMGEIIADAWVEIEDGAQIEPPTGYKYSKPMLYYGSSITEGAHVTRTSNTYSALISNRLDIDYYNFGFSGSAKGDLRFAEYICTLDISMLVLDYDHNAPTAKFLEETHEPFYRYIRERKPDIPVIMTSCPDFDYFDESELRREVIRKTYQNALDRGEDVYFVDGETFFGDKDRHCCTTDTTHPNDLGSYRIAAALEPVIRGILEK